MHDGEDFDPVRKSFVQNPIWRFYEFAQQGVLKLWHDASAVRKRSELVGSPQ